MIAVFGLRRAGMKPAAVEISLRDRQALLGTYARFVGLTIINPATVVYFAAVIIGLGVANDMSVGDGILFSAGAFLASLSWQTFLTVVGAFVGHRLSTRAQTLAIILGNLVILAFAVLILVR